jgi:hypothetical protein
VSFDFGEVTVTYSQQTETGSAGEQIIGKWNVRTQMAS